MIPPRTPLFNLPYLDPSQAQPEVKINEAWNLIDAALGESSSGGGSGSDSGGPGSITVVAVDSPADEVLNVTTLRFHAVVESETDGVAVISGLEGAPGATGATGATGPTGPTGPTGATGSAGSNGTNGTNGTNGAAGVGRPLGAYFLGTASGVAVALPVNAVENLVPSACTIQEVIVLTKGGTGSCTIKVWKANISAHYPPVVTDDITGGANVVISSGTTHQDSTLSGWSKTLAQDDVILFTLSATSTFTSILIAIRVA